MTTPAIAVSDLRRSYEAVEAVRGVSFTVAPGEVFCLLGPNGAGKTTITEILEGYRSRTSGTVSVLGADPAGAGRAWRDRVGIVLQETGVQTTLTVAELLDMYGGWYSRRRPTPELLELVGLEGKAGERVKALSGGQRRRLDLALGLVGCPELLFLDEPTTGFDPEARRRAWRTVRDLTAEGTTVLLTTHFMDEAQALADRVGVMRAGELVAVGTPDEIGGRQDSQVEIRFVLPPGLSSSQVPRPGDATVAVEDHDRVVVRSSDGLGATHAVTSWALEAGHDLPGLTVTRPSLEDVYLELTATPDSEETR